LNAAILIGRLTRDPETKYTQSGKAVCNFTLAVDREFSKEKEADFINIVSYDKDGSKRYMTEVIASQVQFLDWGKGKGKPD